MLVDMWDTILNDLDKGSGASCLISLDFEKAFNRLNHDACIKSLRDHGASEMSGGQNHEGQDWLCSVLSKISKWG